MTVRQFAGDGTLTATTALATTAELEAQVCRVPCGPTSHLPPINTRFTQATVRVTPQVSSLRHTVDEVSKAQSGLASAGGAFQTDHPEALINITH